MPVSLSSEQRDLIEEARRRAHAERRSLAFTVTSALATSAVALWPMMPGAHYLTGALTVGETAAIWAPAIVSGLLGRVFHRRWGVQARSYLLFETLESFCGYASLLGCIFASGLVASPLWTAAPFTAVFWGTSTPFEARRYGGIIAVVHAAMAGGFLLQGRAEVALGVAALAVVMCLLLVSVARGSRQAILLEAERNVEEKRLREELLAEERRRVRGGLWETVGRDVESLVAELERLPAQDRDRDAPVELARAALHEIADLVRGANAEEGQTFADLCRAIDEKCRALCDDGGYEQLSSAADATVIVPGDLARRFVQLSQEMVRNAVVHGQARNVCVELSLGESWTLQVRDDGTGLSATMLAHSAGGLRSAHEWVSARGGALELCRAPLGWSTALRVSVPRGA